MDFPDLVKDPADVVDYTMDWASRLPAGTRILSATSVVNGDCVIDDRTVYTGGVTALTLRITRGTDTGFTGDPQIATLSVVSVTVQLDNGEVRARSFHVIEREM